MVRRHGLPLILASLLATLSGSNLTAAEGAAGREKEALRQAKVDFAHDVQPILQQHCYACHAGDKHEGGLQWDRRASVLKGGDSGKPVYVPGAPDKSRVITLVKRTGDESMPPDGEGKPLPADQVDVLVRWIAEGASWPDALSGPAARSRHWAFVKPVRPALPKVKQADWPRDPLDRFILARLEREGLAPAPEADPYVLVRRVYLDLIGLPPTPQQADAFVHDTRPDAYERLVDGLLSSPHFGERWARMWLDLARYADTQGYEKDNNRTIWRYRDWLINAFNRDLPYDQFTIQQLAGDLLPNPTLDQQVATAFHRNTMTNTEGGTDDEEFRTAAVIDRTNTTSQVWMGLTLGCAECHNHKYDPITQLDYYRFYAFLNQTEDNDQPDERPTIPTPTAEQQKQLAAMDARIAAQKQQVAADTPELRAGQTAWEKQLAKSNLANLLALDPWYSVGPFAAAGPYDSFHDTFGPERNTDLKDTYQHESLAWQAHPTWQDGVFQPLAGSNSAFFLQRTIHAPKASTLHFSLDSGGGIKLWLNGKLSIDEGPVRTAGNQILQEFKLRQGDNLVLIKVSNGGQPGGFFFRVKEEALPTSVVQALQVPAARRTKPQKDDLTRYYRQTAQQLQAARQQLAKLQKQRQALVNAQVTTPIMRELAPAKRRKTYVLIRGNFLSHGAQVEADTPASFPPFPSGTPRNRLGLAQWLVSRDNPLTARVAVNRFWEKIFGAGIVLSTEDFGTQGTPPTHPKLLDYLAIEFMDQGWSMKKLLKRIVMSATYRQSSRTTPELLARDPDNRLLARGPRFRLEAEAIRDQALAASGLLSPKMFGPSVMPPQPEGVWQVVYNMRRWETSEGEDKYRRGLYTFWRRTSPYPSMMAFDATSREVCTIRRIRTNTPLAALVTLNDPVYVEAAQTLARLAVAQHNSTPEQKAATLFRRCLVRPPRPEEIARIVALYQNELAHFRTDPAAAKRLGGAEGDKSAAAEHAAELAAWTVVGNVVLNLDETLTKM